MNQRRSPRSTSFLLRCWQEPRTPTGTNGIWRYSLEDIRTGRRVGFTSLEAVLGYIREQLEETADRQTTNDQRRMTFDENESR